MEKPLTPFARLLQEYMWNRRPPMNAARLARQLEVSQQTVSNWFNTGTIPLPKMLAHIAAKTDIPLDRLFEAAGYPLPDGAVWDYIMSELESDTTLTASTRQVLIARLQEMRDRYQGKRPPDSGGNHTAHNGTTAMFKVLDGKVGRTRRAKA